MSAPDTTDPAVAAAEAELSRLRAEAEAAEAQLKAAQAKAALAAAEAAAAKARAAGAVAAPTDGPPTDVAPAGETEVASPEATAAASDAPPVETSAAPPSSPSVAEDGPLDAEQVQTVIAGYTFSAETLDLGALMNGEAVPEAQIRIPLAMMNRHGLVAGATGTGKTRTLQGLAEQLAARGVPVFAADIKGDLSGVATPGEPSEKLLARTQAIGQDWQPAASVTEYYALGGIGKGIPVRATVSGFGPLLLSKVLGLNATQESSLGLVFHYADANGLALVDLSDLRSVLTYLTSDEGKAELKELGGLSAATAGVILRELITFADGGADVFFGEPEFDVREFLRSAPDARGVISLLEVPGVADKPALFSTFLMYLLAELFEILPEVGDLDKPKLVFFFDEAHLLFKDASKDFTSAIVQTVRLIRSKGVGVFFVTQTPKDVPSDVLAQLGSRVQHALRAFTPDDAKALRATVGTYPRSGYDLERVLQELGTGEAIVTVMSEKGAPTPVAWTRLRAPQGLMSPTPDAAIDAAVAASPLMPKYGTPIDRESAREILAARMNAASEAAAAEEAALAKAKADAEFAKQQAAIDKA
ncbi:MAG: helicase HerA-like domain-containing protein, partial [Microbacterium sp.]